MANLIQNPGAEAGSTTGWVSDGFSATTGGTGQLTAHGGSWIYYTYGWPGNMYQNVPTSPGLQYYISMWAMRTCNTQTYGGHSETVFINADTTNIAGQNDGPYLQWTQYSGYYTAISTSTEIFIAGAGVPGVCSTWFDDISVIALPTPEPTAAPSFKPTRRPTSQPTEQPTDHPTNRPTRDPTNQPTRHPTSRPSVPTSQPSQRPSHLPTSQPSQRPSKPAIKSSGQVKEVSCDTITCGVPILVAICILFFMVVAFIFSPLGTRFKTLVLMAFCKKEPPILPTADPNENGLQTANPTENVLHNPEEKHIMISYCWEQKNAVVALTKYLKDRHGYDICRDEEGSSLMPPMSGSTDAWMADAIEKSVIIIVCVSPAYNRSVNCQKEARFAHMRRDINKVEKILYVMMDPEFVPWKGSINGQLALWIGNDFCYQLFNVQRDLITTGDALAAVIGDVGKKASLNKS